LSRQHTSPLFSLSIALSNLLHGCCDKIKVTAPKKSSFIHIFFISGVYYFPLLKIEISSNGQNCSILSQKVPKFELYQHNDELFNMYYEILVEIGSVVSEENIFLIPSPFFLICIIGQNR
jgi:hypothetical protein